MFIDFIKSKVLEDKNKKSKIYDNTIGSDIFNYDAENNRRQK